MRAFVVVVMSSWRSRQAGLGGAEGWRPAGRRVQLTRLHAAAAGDDSRGAVPQTGDELFRLASDDARGTLDLRQVSPNALAYVGDAVPTRCTPPSSPESTPRPFRAQVLELFWRGRSVWPPAKLADQQRKVVAAVRAEAQAAAVKRLRWGPVGAFALSEADDAWLRRGRNAVGRRGPRRLAASVYADASGLECLAGALYVTDGDRCRALLAALAAIADHGDEDAT